MAERNDFGTEKIRYGILALYTRDARFYLSLEDDLLRLFAADNIASIMDKLGIDRKSTV